ncbi:hypothetical protein ABZX12_18610 [Kribbella sp. NPDC003505]|uniref:hypothetical protein n=1 Tax=Kribbella sp. NPDC003505 TaxID=3154448 RepID=UPI0033AC5633
MKISDLIPTLTGFEELGIEQVCGKPLEEIVDSGTADHPKPSRDILLARVMGAVLIARNDKVTLRAAWDKVLAMPQSELSELLDDEDEEDEVLEDEPVTESGKDGSETGSEPLSSQPSSSSPV